MKKPLISVIMPVYNAEKYVAEAIESILNQTFTDFEFLIFNDGSKDSSAAIVQSYAEKDSRIVFYNYQENTGYLKHLNEGIDKAQGKYIARMDADDISLPQRFEKQTAYMEENEDVGICGTWFEMFENTISNTIMVVKHGVSDFDIKIGLLSHSSLGHPTIMARSPIFKNNQYNQSFYPAEDYELWTRLTLITKFYNIPKVLLYYRWHETNISKEKQEIQIEKTRKVKELQVNRLGLPNQEDMSLFLDFLFSHKDEFTIRLTAKKISNVARIVETTKAMNIENNIYNQDQFNALLNEKWNIIVKTTPSNYDINLLLSFVFSTFPTFSLLSWREKITFVLKCLLKWTTRI